uniref:Lymphocyte specific protein 1 n=1 Tax=Sus scrofa TaxID=9823 RepID=A0A8D0YB05_PIG
MRMKVSATGPRSRSSGGSPGGPGRPRTAGTPFRARVRKGSRRRTEGPPDSRGHCSSSVDPPAPDRPPCPPHLPGHASPPPRLNGPSVRLLLARTPAHLGWPGQHVCGSPARVCLEELCLSPDSELQEELGSEASEPRGPAGPVQGSPGLAETEEGDVQPQRCQQPRTPSPSVLEGTASGSPPLSPSTKLIDRTESLHRSIQKSNSVKKSQPALPISKIDGRLEQYTQAIETAGRAHKLTRQPSIELPSMAVASTKSRWETGEVQAQSAAKPPSCKDIVAGDMSKKSLWEQKGGPKTSSTVKSTPSGKRYKFVAAGHGKYEKVLVDEGSVP